MVFTTVLISAKTILSEFTGTETALGPPSGGTIDCPQGQLTGQYPVGPPCTKGHVHARNLVFQYLEKATDRRMSGTSTVTANADWDGWTAVGPGSGPMWGTVQLRVKDGLWEGSWTGKRTVTTERADSTIHAVMFGTEGSVAGLKVEWNLVSASTPTSSVSKFSGQIIGTQSR